MSEEILVKTNEHTLFMNSHGTIPNLHSNKITKVDKGKKEIWSGWAGEKVPLTSEEPA